jgi:hypothetical protein
MVTKDNIIDLLFQIGFREKEEFEITFNGWEDKLAWKHGDKRYFEYNEYTVEIDVVKNNFDLMGEPADKSSLFFSTNYSLDTSGKDIFNLLKREFKHEMRKLLIKKIIQ